MNVVAGTKNPMLLNIFLSVVTLVKFLDLEHIINYLIDVQV